jgi:hypothetical protein
MEFYPWEILRITALASFLEKNRWLFPVGNIEHKEKEKSYDSWEGFKSERWFKPPFRLLVF